MSTEGNGSPERVASPHQSPTDLISSLTRKLQTRWSTPPIRSNENDTDDGQEFQLRWDGHGNQLTNMVSSLEHDKASSDVTVVTKGASIPSHRLVLAAASPFFHHILQGLPTTQHPVIVVKTVHPRHLRLLVSFCYRGTLTLHSIDIPQVLQLAEDLEIRGLKITLAEGCSSPSIASLAALHPRLFSTSTTRFPFTTPLQRPSSATPTPLGCHDLSTGIKRSLSPPEPKDLMIKKPKIDPLSYAEDKRPHSNPSPFYTPPGSAPPNISALSTSLFFNRPSVSPPHSAPPQSFADSFPRQTSSPVASDSKEELSGVSVVPPSSLLQSSPRSSSRPPSPQFEASSSPSSSPAPSISQTPTSRSARDLSTSSTSSASIARPETGSSAIIGASSGSRVLLWRFLLDLLHDPLYSPIYIRWLDRSEGVFRIMESDMVAQLWGRARKNSNMNYEKMSRGMRTYYKRNILYHIDGTKLIYKFNTNDPDIEQRMKYHDYIQNHPESAVPSEQSTTANLPNPPPVSSPSPSSSSASAAVAAAASLGSLYNIPFLRDVSQMPRSLLYDPCMSLFRTSRPELY